MTNPLMRPLNIWRSLFVLMIFGGCYKQVGAQTSWKKQLQQYIDTKLSKSDGGYGWDDQPDSHIEPTYAVIGILKDIDQLPADKTSLIEFVRKHHPQRTVNKETGPSGFDARILLYHQIQSLVWLGGDLSGFKKEVGGWKSDANNLYNYETHNYGVLMQEVMTPVCRNLLQISVDDISPSFKNYLNERKRQNGSYNNAPAANGDGNVLNTWWSLYTLKILGENNTSQNQIITWLQSCQLKDGGFTHQPHPQIAGNDEVVYTWAAVKSLELSGAKPANLKGCIKYLLSLRNTDGGFGNRPGLPSTPMSTYYAIDALKTLNAFSSLDAAKPPVQALVRNTEDLSKLKVFTVQFEAQGSGSPSEAVMLADSFHIHLWGAKNGNAAWSAEAQRIANEKKVPVTFFYADEPYGKNVSVDGMGTFGHILDYFAPVNAPALKIENETPWPQYRKTVVEPLLNNKGGLILQISNNEAMCRMLLDESVKNGGYAAISTIHFGQNFLFFLPFLYQYRYQLPLVALQDAHGTESWWWSNDLLAYRTLFLATEPTHDGLLKALKNNWVVAVRHDSVSAFKTRMLGGAAGVQEYVLSQQKNWKWWDESGNELIHPWAAITVLHPADSFETASPDKGINVRIRCWWDTNKQIMKAPLVKLEQLRIDNTPAEHQYIEQKDRRGAVTDSYYLYTSKKLSPGTHTLQASLRNLKTNTARIMIRQFEVGNE